MRWVTPEQLPNPRPASAPGLISQASSFREMMYVLSYQKKKKIKYLVFYFFESTIVSYLYLKHGWSKILKGLNFVMEKKHHIF